MAEDVSITADAELEVAMFAGEPPIEDLGHGEPVLTESKSNRCPLVGCRVIWTELDVDSH